MDITLAPPGVLDKAVTVLDALESGPCHLAELVARSHLPRATAHRLATHLERLGLVRRDDQGRFALGLRLVALGRAAIEALPVAEAARPALIELRDATGESAQLYIRDGDRRVCVASLQSPHALRTIVALGAMLPLDQGSAGRVLGGSAQALDQGWLESVAEREAGVASVSAPVCDAEGNVVAAVSVSGPIERTTRQPGRLYSAAVTAAARRIEREAVFA